ncbi:MAG TPA: transposase [Rubrobacter sp.]|nr:transposase [Rubrobacter sp.]
MAEPDEKKRVFRLGWSTWRRAHQALAARYRKASRAAKRALDGEAEVEDRAGPSTTTLCAEGAPLTDEEWQMVEPLFLPNKPPAGRPFNDHRKVLGGIMWVAGTGSSWREMPEEYGKWETAYRRYELWLRQGLLQRILQALGEGALPGPATKKTN